MERARHQVKTMRLVAPSCSARVRYGQVEQSTKIMPNSLPSISDMHERALSFGSIAEHYARFRPPPPEEAVDWVLGDVRGTVLDLGAGTGALTGRLLPRVRRILAAEPDREMQAVLRERLAAVPLVTATAEALPFGSSNFDGVVVSSAWHWMDPEIAPIEVGRVLRPGGVLGLIWNGADRSVQWVKEVFGRSQPSRDSDGELWPDPGHSTQSHRHALELSSSAPFHDLESRVVRWSKSFTVDELVGLMGSYSRVFTLPDEPRQRLLDKVEAEARSRIRSTGEATIELPMACQCWRATRN